MLLDVSVNYTLQNRNIALYRCLQLTLASAEISLFPPRPGKAGIQLASCKIDTGEKVAGT
jgi:hypothetical protein